MGWPDSLADRAEGMIGSYARRRSVFFHLLEAGGEAAMADNLSDSQSDLAIGNVREPHLGEAGFAPTLPATTPHPALAPTLQGPTTPLPKGSKGDDPVSPVPSDLALVAVPGTIPGPLKDWERYEVVRPLGQGGMGTVFLARDTRLGRLVALKFLRLPSPDAADRMLQEARAQARLDHPGICKVSVRC